ncbi:MAG: 2-iminoacetate synthase ThiH [Verrucomicrobiae bacterium]|nr:2-iminoacetate synthase ThiH [Verrucomicrobiae bacterium]
MPFLDVFRELPLRRWVTEAEGTRPEAVRALLARGEGLGLGEFARLLSPAAAECLEAMAQRSQALTRRRFGRVIRLFAPVYLSNECINNCAYCGFSRDNAILRVTLSVEEVAHEVRALRDQGFRQILLVAGEHPRFVSEGYLEACVGAVAKLVPGVSLEVGPMEADEYRPLVGAGAEGLVVYQETYDRERYASVHTLGPKKDFEWRLATPERAYQAGFRRLGIGALFGLADWRTEALAVAAHALWLLRNCWKAQITISLPRLRPCAGGYTPERPLGDRELVQLVTAFRILLPDVGLVLSTREPARLRDGLVPLGITLMSAGSHTEPGGYTGVGRDKVHYTERGRRVAVREGEGEPGAGRRTGATGQFEIADERPAGEVAGVLAALGLEPVWKDGDAALTGAGSGGLEGPEAGRLAGSV